MRYDVIIVGGAVMGSATAYYLSRLDPGLSIVVFDKDFSFSQASSLLNDGNVRVQFNLPENIRMSQFAWEALATFDDDMAVGDWRPGVTVRQQGNLFLATAEGEQDARAGLMAQQELGCDVEWLTADEIAARFPPYRGAWYVGGTLGPQDGFVDPHAVFHGYRRRAIRQGVNYAEAEVIALAAIDGHMSGVTLADGTNVSAPVVVNAAGAWCAPLAATAGIELPVSPVMRNVFVVEGSVDVAGMPSVFHPSGLHVLPEPGDRFLCGWSQDDDPVGFDFRVTQRFEELIWPELVERFPAFDALQVVGSWAGLYAVNTFDGNGIIGPWPGIEGLHLANGFSGHGFQQCHAVGRHLAELITGKEPSLDLERLSPRRIQRNEPLYEHAGRII